MKFKFLLSKSHFMEGIYKFASHTNRKIDRTKIFGRFTRDFSVETEDSSTCKRI